jgi:thiamine biosynthesis lipoprotein
LCLYSNQELKLTDSAYYSEDHLLYHNHFAAMGTRLDMIFCGHSRQEGHRLAEVISQELKRLEIMMSRFQENSPVWMVNQLAGKKSLSLDEELFNIFLTCKEYHELTGGLFDIALGSVMDLIRQGEYDQSTFINHLDSSGMQQLVLDPEKMTIRFRNEKVQVDFGGFGKGYALERIRKLLLSHEILNAFISFGESSVLALGNHPHGSGWKAGVNHQMITGKSLLSFDLQNESLSTSGITSGHRDHGRRGQILHPVRGLTDRKYHHISIKSSSALEAEVLSTALIPADESESKRILAGFHASKAVGIIYDLQAEATIEYLT